MSSVKHELERVYEYDNEPKNTWFPCPIDSEKGEYGKYDNSLPNCCLMVMRCIPIIGNITSMIQDGKDASHYKNGSLDSNGRWYNKIEYAKCERLGAILLILTGIALLALFPNVGQGNKAFVIAGGTALGLGSIEALYFSRKMNKIRSYDY